MKNPIQINAQAKGFALVATLALMILLAILAVGLLSLSAVTLRAGGQGSAQAEARANARMALMVAIGELQKQMGPDQRVSANGSILSDSTINHPHWTGVWDSWVAGSLSSAPVNENYPDGSGDSAESHHQTLGQQPVGSMRPAYDKKDGHFRAWLLSLDEDESRNPDLPSELALESQAMPGKASNAVRLVGEGSLGKGTSADHVTARLLPVRKRTTAGNPAGRYAWWVGDESQKARVMHNSYHGETLTSADKIFRSQAPASTGTTVIRGLADLTPAQEQRLEGLPTLDTLDLVPGVREINEGGTFRASQKGFHSVTPFSRAVLADVREGGLKRDLSTLLERPIDPTEISDEFMLYKFDVKDAWANDTSKYPTLPETPQECVPIQDLAAFYQLYDQSRKAGVQYTSGNLPNSIQVVNPDYGNATDYTTKFEREYTTLYRNPVPIKIQFLISLSAEPITQADRVAVWSGIQVNRFIPETDTHKLRFSVIPAVTMWNPYNVPIVMESGESRAQQITVDSPPLIFDIRKIPGDGGTPITSRLSLNQIIAGGEAFHGRNDLIRLNQDTQRSHIGILQVGQPDSAAHPSRAKIGVREDVGFMRP